MTDQTTAAPSGRSAHREAAVEVEDLLSHLDSAEPDTLEVAFGRGRRYRLHTRTLRLARTALRQHQHRIDVAHDGIAAQGPTDVDVVQVRHLSMLVTDLVNATNWPTLDLAIMNIKPDALAAVLRAGLASVVGDATEVSIDSTPAPEPASVEVPSPAAEAGPSSYGSTYATENPVRQAVYDVLTNGDSTTVSDVVRDITIAALDAAAIEVRGAVATPSVSPIVMLDAPVPADRVVQLVGRVRESAADAASDELRILARSDVVR